MSGVRPVGAAVCRARLCLWERRLAQGPPAVPAPRAHTPAGFWGMKEVSLSFIGFKALVPFVTLSQLRQVPQSPLAGTCRCPNGGAGGPHTNPRAPFRSLLCPCGTHGRFNQGRGTVRKMSVAASGEMTKLLELSNRDFKEMTQY